MKTFLFVASIFILIWWGSINIAKLFSQEKIPSGNFIIMSLAATAVITHIINIW